jgi:soluble lytic murein transglycosylase
MASFCKQLPPITGRGMIACLRAHAGGEELRDHWLHQAWAQGDYTDDEEKQILADYAKSLDRNDHIARMERLLYERKASQARRILSLVPPEKRAVYKVRIEWILNDHHAKGDLHHLTAVEQRDVGISYDRASTALATNKTDTLVELVESIPASAPYPDLWWPLRNVAIREELAKHRYKMALEILGRHGDITGEQLAEALWLKGWITLDYNHDAGAAYKDFRALYVAVSTPVSLARAAYWAARAAEANGNTDIAEEWYKKAARFPTVFYGQLAHSALHPHAPLNLPPTPVISADAKQAFESDEQIAVIRMLLEQDDAQMADRFLNHLASHATEPAQFALLANFARKEMSISRGVRVAKQAIRKQVTLIDTGWPQMDLPPRLGVEPALALAISRQESEFDPHAQSPANAHGLMQLLPDTARHIARKNDLPYDAHSLDDPEQNLTLGSAYLGQIIRGFNGSYILGIASYNAGPSNIRSWINANGNPPKTLPGTLRWIESIPFGETRNYVMRVMENLQLYRTLDNADAPLELPQDLLR